MQNQDGLEARVKALEADIVRFTEEKIYRTIREYKTDAESFAMYAALIFLAEKAGISREKFVARFKKKERAVYETFITKLEDSQPGLAAMLDEDRESDSGEVANPGDPF